MIGTKKKTTPTLSEQIGNAKAQAALALSTFETVALDLEDSAETLADLQALAQDEIDRLTAQVDESAEAESAYRARAAKIRDLIA